MTCPRSCRDGSGARSALTSEAAEDHFAALTPREVKESDELYFLSADGDTVKVRDDLMDIKVLKEVNDDGLEQWTPVMKAAFPLPAADVAKVFEALRLDAPPFARDAYALDQFIDELASPGSGIRAVQVHKRRTRYSFGGCMTELTDVVADGRYSADDRD